MKKFIVILTMALGLSTTLAATANAQQTINSDEAQEIAKQAVNGKILNIGLEHEHNMLVYDVDMQTNLNSVEVIINAFTGKIISMKTEIEGAVD